MIFVKLLKSVLHFGCTFSTIRLFLILLGGNHNGINQQQSCFELD